LLKRWVPVVFYVVALLVFSAQPESSAASMNSWVERLLPHLNRSEVRELVFLVRKSVHVLAYGTAALLFYYAVSGTALLRRRPYLWAGGLGLLLAVVDEWYQSTLPHRTGSVDDVLLDGVGIAGMLMALYLFGDRRKKHITGNTAQDEVGGEPHAENKS